MALTSEGRVAEKKIEAALKEYCGSEVDGWVVVAHWFTDEGKRSEIVMLYPKQAWPLTAGLVKIAADGLGRPQ